MPKKILILGTFLIAAILLGCTDIEHKDTLNKIEAPGKEPVDVKEKVALKHMTAEEYLKNYNKIKSTVSTQGIEILPFNLELEKKSNTYRFYYPKEVDKSDQDMKWVSVMLGENGKVIDGIMYTGYADIPTIKAMIQATNITWTNKLDQLIGSIGNEDFSKTLEIEKVKLSVKGNSKNIKVMIDSMKLDPPQSL
ncbi:hypothetical protein [Bacillus sp. ISO11]|uniref:hypothetical protein n=1 Tax=Bacillus sp. ISO11 TaxID=1826752 RepID=UPI000E4E1CBB|nr:hypothetical protein [Bacillus sp. ISO11]RGP96491.1 hypothetical protein D1166_29690 [Bacillus sp. ISO11]